MDVKIVQFIQDLTKNQSDLNLNELPLNYQTNNLSHDESKLSNFSNLDCNSQEDEEFLNENININNKQ